jgi:hypothetical protein
MALACTAEHDSATIHLFCLCSCACLGYLLCALFLIHLALPFSLQLNNITGSGMVLFPSLYQASGWFPVSIALLAVCGLSYICSIMVIEAMAAMPGNAKFDKRVECQFSPRITHGRKLGNSTACAHCNHKLAFVAYRAPILDLFLSSLRLCVQTPRWLIIIWAVSRQAHSLCPLACCPVQSPVDGLRLLTVHFHRRCLSASFLFVPGYGYGVTQVFFQLSLACNNISSIIQSVQVMDFAIADIFGRSCSVPEFSPEFKFYCPEAIDGQRTDCHAKQGLLHLSSVMC